MKDLDFQVGDKVFSLLHGNGIVIMSEVKVKNNEKIPKEAVMVGFQHVPLIGQFTTDGHIMYNNNYQFRTLYHGHDLDITIEEKKPIRHRWPNIYKHKDTYIKTIEFTETNNPGIV